jgi:hypothetical protein
MAAQLPDAKHAQQASDELEGAVVVDIGAVHAGKRRYVLPEESRLRGGERLVFDVLLENQAAGHRFPGGARDMHDVWVEVEVRDAAGRLLAISRPTADGNDDVFVLRTTILDAAAEPEILHQVHRFSAPAFDPTHGRFATQWSSRISSSSRYELARDCFTASTACSFKPWPAKLAAPSEASPSQ